METLEQAVPRRDPRAMVNKIDVRIRLEDFPGKDSAEAREAVRKLLAHASKENISAQEAESFKEAARALLDGRQDGGSVDYSYRTDAARFDIDSFSAVSACFPEGHPLRAEISKHDQEVHSSKDASDISYWNHVILEAEKGNTTRLALAHCEPGSDIPVERSVREIGKGNFCRNMEELGYMAASFSAQQAALERRRMLEAEAQNLLKDPERAQERQM